MNIEEARKTIEELLNSNEPICEYMLKHQEIEAMQKLLNELDKKDKVIDLIVNTIVGDRKILKLVCNKIINKKEDECFEQNKLCDDCIKEYFYNKIGGNIDKK